MPHQSGMDPSEFMFRMDDDEEPTLKVNDHGGYFDFAPVDLGGKLPARNRDGA